jgi:D-sedoheptulose 7-phosphate isomerase
MELVAKYIRETSDTISQLPVALIQEVVEILHAARLNRKHVFIMGNGGSAATASHFACDLGKGTADPRTPRLRVVALTDNMPTFSAWANDTAYDNVFAEQLWNLVEPGDVVIGISGSGRSMNVLKAIHLANLVGATTVGLTGFDGGDLAKIVHVPIVVPSNMMEQVEDVHMMLSHLITTRLRAMSEALPAPGELALDRFPARQEKAREVLDSIPRQLAQALPATMSTVSLLDDQGDTLVIHSGHRLHGAPGGIEEVSGRQVRMVNAPAHSLVVHRQRPTIFRQDELTISLPRKELEVTLDESVCSGAIIPLVIDGRSVGVISIGEVRSWGRTPFDEKKLSLSWEIARRAIDQLMVVGTST